MLYCAFCGGETGTRDHCPSKAFLDRPYPEDLPVVPACHQCNATFSTDEEYLACLLSCVLAGSTDPDIVSRPSVKRALQHSAALRARIERSRQEDDGQVIFNPEHQRVIPIVTKLAQGHALYELHEPCSINPDVVWATPLALLSEDDLQAFESPDSPNVWPEVGSRAMQRLVVGGETKSHWVVVQPGMYRYLALPGTVVHIVIQEYLAGYVRWD
jgi:hypothetical protein